MIQMLIGQWPEFKQPQFEGKGSQMTPIVSGKQRNTALSLEFKIQK